jgi:peroxiredoxin Q/BCP
LSTFLGEKCVVLFFYPKDNTSGCTAESCSFRDSSDDFRKFNALLFGISKDDASSHRDFIKRNRLTYPLLIDEGDKVSKSYGVPKTLGIFPGRATFVVDKGGIIRSAYSSQMNVNKHVDLALEVVQQLASTHN